ncbi:MAG: DUF1848 family protein [Candidatus Firestonebacteria bacterium]|nr:DUF1848 family protein [Candidatus Firestonebacteria bacterium]
MENKNIVISASRRTDLVGVYPDIFADKLEEYSPQIVHTVVIWTKNPANIFNNSRLYKKLLEYRQIYIHLTVTGMGGTDLEPGIPASENIFELLPELIKFVSNPERISWRFDPIIRVKKDDELFTNIKYFDFLLDRISSLGIKTCRTSWVFPYKKVLNNLRKKKYELVFPAYEEMKRDYDYLNKKLKQKNMSFAVCAMEGFEQSRCINGHLLSNLHPDKIECSKIRAKGQRKFCGCTESIDIGSYGLKCLQGCIYCYANPLVN